jgi:hypothetical protein
MTHLGFRATSALARTCTALQHRLQNAVFGLRLEFEIEAQSIGRRAAQAGSPEAVAAVLAEAARNPLADREAVTMALSDRLPSMRVGRDAAEQMLRIAIDKEPYARACRLRYGCCRKLFTHGQLRAMRERDLLRLYELPPDMRGEVLAVLAGSHSGEDGVDPAIGHRYLEMAMAHAPASCGIVARALVDSGAFSCFKTGMAALPLYFALLRVAANVRGPDGNLDTHGVAIVESLVAALDSPIARMRMLDKSLPPGGFRPVFDAVCDMARHVAPAQRGRMLGCLAAGLPLPVCAVDPPSRMQAWLQLDLLAEALPPEARADYMERLLRTFSGATPDEAGVYRGWWIAAVATLPAPQAARALNDFVNAQGSQPWDAATISAYMARLESLPPQHRSPVLVAYIDRRQKHARLPDIDALLHGLAPEHRELPMQAVLRRVLPDHGWREPFDPPAPALASVAKRHKGDDALTWALGQLEALPAAVRGRVLVHHLGWHKFTAIDRAWREIMQMVRNLPQPEREAGIRAVVHATLRPGQRKSLQLDTWSTCLEAVRTIPPTSPERATALEYLEASIDALPLAVRAARRQEIANAAPPRTAAPRDA